MSSGGDSGLRGSGSRVVVGELSSGSGKITSRCFAGVAMRGGSLAGRALSTGFNDRPQAACRHRCDQYAGAPGQRAIAGDPDRGFRFDGRIAEDFKLATGTWVSVGPLRLRFLAHC